MRIREESTAWYKYDPADILRRDYPTHANTIIAEDSSQVTYMGTTTFYRAQRPNSLLYMGTYATLGYGLPAVIGAKVAAPIDQLFVSLATAPSCSPYKKS